MTEPIISTCSSLQSTREASFDPRNTKLRPRTSESRTRTVTTSTGFNDNEIICSIAESRGISPTIGLSFVNVSTSEAVLCQFADTHTYARTCHKIMVFNPTEIIYMTTATDSKLMTTVKENLEVEINSILMTSIDRRYWSDTTGYEHLQRLSFPDDLESLKVSIGANYFAICCFAAEAVKYVELGMGLCFAAETLRIRFEASEGSMMIDLSTISSLELIKNLQQGKSKDNLLGVLQETLTPMGARVLRSNVLQPSTDATKITQRYEALDELVTKEEIFLSLRNALKSFVDTDRILAALVVQPTKINFQYMEQSVNNVLMLKAFITLIKPLWQALAGPESIELQRIYQQCHLENYCQIEALINYTLNEDVTYSTQPTELRNQRVYALKVGVNKFLDVARQTYKEATQDVMDLVTDLKDQYGLAIDLKFEPARQFYLRITVSELGERRLPEVFVHVYHRKKMIECHTLDLMKMNQKIKDAHNEVVALSDKSIQELIVQVRTKIYPLFKISEGIAMLDMLAAMAQVITTHDYIKPELTDTLAIKAGRHPIHEKIRKDKFVPNDVYATQQSRFQIITGCNMSGKSTYIRSIALMTVMAQIGCFVPARKAYFPIFHQLFARISTDDSIEANVSTFASEMRETSFILRNIEPRSLVIVDELGRGTSTADGLAIAIAIAEALIESKAFVWFVTHFRDLPRILAERAGVVNLHLAVDIATDLSKMKMKYKVADGYEEEKFYGLALAKVLDLPAEVMEVATKVSQALHRRNEAKKSNARTLAVARRRKAILNLREQLMQARESTMDPEGLRMWLKRLQDEFAVRMKAIDTEAASFEDPEIHSDGIDDRHPTQETDDLEESSTQNQMSHELQKTPPGDRASDPMTVSSPFPSSAMHGSSMAARRKYLSPMSRSGSNAY